MLVGAGTSGGCVFQKQESEHIKGEMKQVLVVDISEGNWIKMKGSRNHRMQVLLGHGKDFYLLPRSNSKLLKCFKEEK
jgi:hypothetical protein